MTEAMPTTDRGVFRTWFSERSLYMRTMLVLWAVALFFLLMSVLHAVTANNTPEEEYLSDVHKFLSSEVQEHYSDHQLVAFGYQTCTLEDQGYSATYANRVLVRQTGMSYADAGEINLAGDASGLCSVQH